MLIINIMAKINYNERSWAIDAISEICLYLSRKRWYFKSAGGENTINENKSSLFPDVLLFKDTDKEDILHGWELKMPDTAINDPDLIDNAKKKARILKRDSFLVWNVKTAALYVKDRESFSVYKTWDSIDINNRNEVKPKEALWKALLHQILEDLNNFFEAGEISDTAFEILAVDTVIDVILENVASTVGNLKVRMRASARFAAEINQWWFSSASEYGYNPSKESDKPHQLPTLSKVILTDWVIKIVFAHILKRYFNEARSIETITDATSIAEAEQIISDISTNCDFWNIFNKNLAQEYISSTAWAQLIQISRYLTTINIQDIDIEVLHTLLQSSIDAAKRKVAGQFSTPVNLASLLVRLTIENKELNVFDPCCGTGTIINQAYLLKEEYDIPHNEILSSIWASDKHSFPIQLATLTLSKPDNIGEIVNIFSSDVIELNVDQRIKFHNPNDGAEVEKELPHMNYIVSNLPFIREKAIKELNPDIADINTWIRNEAGLDLSLSGKSDIFAYIPFYLYRILGEESKVGFILSNAWMGTDYGDIFLRLFQQFYSIENIVISGKGKWFHNAEVVTTIITATKKNAVGAEEDRDRTITFTTLNEFIENVNDTRQVADAILVNGENRHLTNQQYTVANIHEFESIGIPWCAYFAEITWLPEIVDQIVSCNQIFDFTRGERRGWNELFYPAKGHGIEEEYIKPVLKNLRQTTALICTTNKDAFCCPRSIQELEELNHTGALNWIRHFENQVNETGVPLTQSLQRANMHWYEMKTDNMADFVANVNYDKSLFIPMLQERSFIDQRLIGLSLKEEYQGEDKSLFLALFNSILSMFFIECMGFGRGLGALDLRATKFESDFKMLNPNILSLRDKARIIEAFAPIMRRDRLNLEQEMEQADRVHFEMILFEIYGIQEYYESIKKSLLHLYKIRFAVKESVD
ncbi:MAG: N-6 DNA methylase [Bacteroidales bacterium]